MEVAIKPVPYPSNGETGKEVVGLDLPSAQQFDYLDWPGEK